MTPELIIRSFTNDQYFLDKVFYTNYYKIKGQDKEKPVILDIGAHIGYFVFSALSLGAKKIYAFEPLADNYEYLVRNVQNWKLHFGNIQVYNLGVYTKDIFGKLSVPTVKNDTTIEYSETEMSTDGQPTMFVSLDTIFTQYCTEPVDILKINIGYAESDILFASKLLAERVASICGETALPEKELADFKVKMFNLGYVNSFFDKSIDDESKNLFIFSKKELKDSFKI
jgi:FkbM family methyltransferase